MLTCGPQLAEGEGGSGGERAHVGRCAREGESAARAGRKWAGARPTREKGKREESWASGKLGLGKRGRERFWLMGCYLLLLFFYSSTLKLLKQIHLNSNEFEFKLYKLNTNKTNAPA
jgi:hypothetical protein